MPIDFNAPIEIRDIRNGDWFWISKHVWNNQNLTPSDKVVYGTLAFFTNNQKQSAWPNLDKLAEFSGLSRRQIYKSTKKLEEVHYISVRRHHTKGNPNEYLLLKVKGEKFSPHLSNKGEKNAQNRGNTVPPNNTNKNNINIISKDIILQDTHKREKEVENPEGLNGLLSAFKSVNPSYKTLFANKTQRASLSRLVNEHGEEKVSRMINFLPSIINRPYAPTITTPYQLEQRLGDLIAFIRKERKKKGGVYDATNI